MRQKRAKAYRKLMASFCISFGFRQPYQVLVDSEICKFAVESNVDLAKQLKVVLQGEVKPMITQCCIHQIYLQGKPAQSAVDLAKTFERRKCNHREPIAEDDCLLSVVGDINKHRYVVATQSQPLRSNLWNIPAVPVIHVTRSVFVLAPSSSVTQSAKESIEAEALQASSSDLSLIPPSSEPPLRKKKKGPKGPNPLSVKKKKPNTNAAQQSSTTKNAGSSNAAPVKAGTKRKEHPTDGGEAHATQNPDTDSGPHGEKKGKRRRKHHGAHQASQTVDQS